MTPGMPHFPCYPTFNPFLTQQLLSDSKSEEQKKREYEKIAKNRLFSDGLSSLLNGTLPNLHYALSRDAVIRGPDNTFSTAYIDRITNPKTTGNGFKAPNPSSIKRLHYALHGNEYYLIGFLVNRIRALFTNPSKTTQG